MKQSKSDLDEQQGFTRADEHLSYAAQVLTPGFELEAERRAATTTSSNSDSATVEVSYRVLDADSSNSSGARNQVAFSRLDAWWQERDYDIVTRTIQKADRTLKVRDRDDGFVLTLSQEPTGMLRLSAVSPPVRATGAPPPAAPKL